MRRGRRERERGGGRASQPDRQRQTVVQTRRCAVCTDCGVASLHTRPRPRTWTTAPGSEGLCSILWRSFLVRREGRRESVRGREGEREKEREGERERERECALRRKG